MTAKYKDIEERYEMRKRFISFFMVLCMTASLLPVFSLPVSAATTADKYGYGHGNNVLKNPGADIKQLLEPVWHQIRKVFEQR